MTLFYIFDGINEKHAFLAFQMIKDHNTNFGVVMLNHMYPPFAIDEKIIN